MTAPIRATPSPSLPQTPPALPPRKAAALIPEGAFARVKVSGVPNPAGRGRFSRSRALLEPKGAVSAAALLWRLRPEARYVREVGEMLFMAAAPVGTGEALAVPHPEEARCM